MVTSEVGDCIKTGRDASRREPKRGVAALEVIRNLKGELICKKYKYLEKDWNK